MPTTEAQHIASIKASPDADGPRLVFADWLEERGECARAEFIRVQVELAKLSNPWTVEDCNAPAYTELGMIACEEWNSRHWSRNNWCRPCRNRHTLRASEAELLAEHGREWALAGMPKEWTYENGTIAIDALEYFEEVGYELQSKLMQIDFSRGLRHKLTCRAEELLAHGAAIFAAAPELMRCKLTTRPGLDWMVMMAQKYQRAIDLSQGWDDELWRIVLNAEFPTIPADGWELPPEPARGGTEPELLGENVDVTHFSSFSMSEPWTRRR